MGITFREMPNHWESSGRPLFVKTVFVNGNRHAILSQEDPLLRPGIPLSRKQSRPNSSSSFGIDPSNSSSESQESGPEAVEEIRSSKPGKVGPGQRKDISSELQSCCKLIKLRLTSSIRENKMKSKEEVFDNSQEETQSSEGESFKQKRKKWNRGKNLKENFENGNNVVEYKSGRDKRYYVYNFDASRKGKKNYCFVKISSKPPQYILDCSCENNFCGSKDSDKNLLISASFHNLIMTSDKNENVFKNSANYFFKFGDSDSCDAKNNYVARSYYNSLTERVLQWLDMGKRQKKKAEKEDGTELISKDVSVDKKERIFAGETFLDEGRKIRNLNKSPMTRVFENWDQKVSDDVETEVKVEPNIEIILSRHKLKSAALEHNSQMKTSRSLIEVSERESSAEPERQESTFSLISIPAKTDFASKNLKNWTGLDSSVSCVTKSSFNEFRWSRIDSSHSRIKRRLPKEKRSELKRKEMSEGDDTDENNFKISETKTWNQKTDKTGRFEWEGESPKRTNPYRSEINREKGANGLKNQMLTQEFTERYQKSINNLNITRSLPVFSQNLSSPQQHNGCWLREGKAVQPGEKDLGRPQLHIFMPSIPSKDPGEESMSECDSFISDVG